MKQEKNKAQKGSQLSKGSKKKSISITVVSHFDWVKIYFNDIIHLRFVWKQLIGYQSWRDNDASFHIEYTFKGGETIQTQYDSFEKWKAILEGLDKIY